MWKKGKCCSAVTSSSPVKWGSNLRYYWGMEFIGCAIFSGAYIFNKNASATIFTPWLIASWAVEADEPAMKVNEGGGKTDMGVGWWTMVEEQSIGTCWSCVK